MPDINEPTEATPDVCPFCGGKAHLVGDRLRGYWVECISIYCFGPHTSEYGVKAEAIAAWNRRVASALSFADGIKVAKDALAHLVAAVSLLKRGGKKAAPSDKMFKQMLADYDASIERCRAAIRALAHNPQASSGGYDPTTQPYDEPFRHTDPQRSGAAEGNEAEAVAPKPDPAIAELVEQIIAGNGPIGKWVGSIDYSTYEGFEKYLEVQLREALHLKASLDKKRDNDAVSESLATFVDGKSGAIEEALATFRTVRARETAALTASNDRVAELERERDEALATMTRATEAMVECGNLLADEELKREAAEAEVSRLKAGAVTDEMVEAAHVAYEANVPDDYRYSSEALRAAIHAAFGSRPLQSSQGEQMTLDELIERVEKATGPDREIDIDLCLLTEENSEAEYRRYCRMVPKGSPTVRQFITDRLCFRYTSSLDAIVGLIETKLPEAFGNIAVGNLAGGTRLFYSLHPTPETVFGIGATSALATCAAFLKALRALQQRETV